ncbi:ribonuclease E/G [Terasakiella sp. SH-1]|uniref:ribonuclease E/G n=1 Tax=Terasakiella sp. SH-1 TaxID=2560057 RepID=UPI001073E181|nr:ribonuclease E/G [Terasakiella sp. SH-1]
MRRLLIDHIPGETRIALLENDRLVRLEIDRATMPGHSPCHEGNIYWGRVVNIVPSLQAAFVDIGTGINGFLPVNGTFGEEINKAVHEGQALLVQVRKAPQGDKGPLLTCKLDLNSPDCVLTIGRPGVNVSRKIADQKKRTQFKSYFTDMIAPPLGLIIRTSAQSFSLEKLEQQIHPLLEKWSSINTVPEKIPALAETSEHFIENLWHEFETYDFDEILVEGLEAYQILHRLSPKATLYSAPLPLFQQEGVNEEIEQANQKVLPLPSGGTLVIEPTTALIAIDINMGNRTDGRDAQTNRLTTNLEALEILSREITLRNLSGQIVIDFINLKQKTARDKLLAACKTHLEDDRTTVHGFTRLGLMEISRQRQGYRLDELLNTPENAFYDLIKALSRTPQLKALLLSPNLYQHWHMTKYAPTLNWLFDRLGYVIKPTESNSLPAFTYQIQEN